MTIFFLPFRIFTNYGCKNIYLPNALQIAMFSKIPTTGNTRIPEPMFWTISKKFTVPLRASNLGNSKSGKPPGNSPKRWNEDQRSFYRKNPPSHVVLGGQFSWNWHFSNIRNHRIETVFVWNFSMQIVPGTLPKVFPSFGLTHRWWEKGAVWFENFMHHWLSLSWSIRIVSTEILKQSKLSR